MSGSGVELADAVSWSQASQWRTALSNGDRLERAFNPWGGAATQSMPGIPKSPKRFAYRIEGGTPLLQLVPSFCLVAGPRPTGAGA
jgi:hypothetical protein